MNTLTAATPSERLAAFQSRHLIAPATVNDPILGAQVVCSVDAIRVHPIRTGWRHDTAETTRLLREVNGGSWPRASVAAVAADVAREDAFVNGRLTFERVIGNQTFAIDVDLADDEDDEDDEDDPEAEDDDGWTNREGMPEFNGAFR